MTQARTVVDTIEQSPSIFRMIDLLDDAMDTLKKLDDEDGALYVYSLHIVVIPGSAVSEEKETQ